MKKGHIRFFVAITALFSLITISTHAQPAKQDLANSAPNITVQTPNPEPPRAAATPETGLIPIVIYHTNDIHGNIGPILPDDRGKASGGAASLATLFKRETRPYLWLDSGDWFQGTPEGNMSRGEAVFAVFNAMNLAATVPGNHDFDYGEAATMQLAAKAKFPILGSNVVSKRTGKTAPYLQHHVLKPIAKGITIGLFGLVTEFMPNMTFPQNIQDLSFTEITEAAKREVKELKKEGATIVIAVNHLGIEQYGETKYDITGGRGDLLVAGTVPGINFILGSHTHTALFQPIAVPNKGGQTMIFQTRGKLAQVNQIVIYVDPKTGQVRNFESRLIPLDPAVFPPDPAIMAIVNHYKGQVESVMSKPVGAAAVPLPRSYQGESVLGNWITDVLKRYGKTDIGMINSFGMRADIPAGPLTFRDFYQMSPFDNCISRMEISGAALKLAIDQQGAEPLQFSGIELVFAPKAPAGQRIKSMKINGMAVDDNRIYTVTTTDFVSTVSAPFQPVPRNIQPSTIGFRDLLIKAAQDSSPISARLEGRIKLAY